MDTHKKISHDVLLYLAGCFFFSGLCGLIYQVIWTRSLSLIFGHTTFAISTVITAFMGGLALGSFVLGRWSDSGGNLKKHLAPHGASPLFLMYGILEGLIGIYCLMTPLLFKGVEALYLQCSGLSFHAMSLLRFVLCLAVLIIPTFCMGGTLPLLSRFLIRSEKDIGQNLGLLYFINTLGAMAGTILAGFFLIQNVGLHGTLQAAAVINIGIGLLVYAINRRGDALFEDPPAVLPAVLPAEVAEEIKAESDPAGSSHLPLALIVVIFSLTGFASMIYEIAWTRALGLALGNSTYAFSTMLATFLAGIALGSLIYSFMARKREFSPATFGWLEVLIGLSALLCIPLLGSMPLYFIKIFPYVKSSYTLIMGVDFLLSFLVMLVPTTLMGIIFPLVGRLYARSVDSLGRSVGNIYAINTMGCIAGSALTGFVLIPLLGVQSSLKLAVAINFASGFLILAVTCRKPVLRMAGIALAVLFFILLKFLPPWNPAVMSSGAAVYTEQYQKIASSFFYNESNKPVFYRDGISTSISVLKVDDDFVLRVNGITNASTKKDMPTQLLLGYLPALYHENPESAYVIGLGSGMSATAVLQFPSAKIVECAEIEPAVVEANNFFAPFNGNVLSNDRFRLSLVDGRNGLMASPRKYDLIISQPSHPWMSGTASIFSTEFYTICRNRLSDRGIMLSWITLSSMQPDDVKMVLRTFYEVFPYGSLWQGTARSLLLMGSTSPMTFNNDLYQTSFKNNQAFQKSLKQIGIEEPDALFAHYICEAKDIEPLILTATLNSDNFPVLEYTAPKNLYIDTLTANAEGLSTYKSQLTPPLKRPVERLSPAFYKKLWELYSMANPPLAAVFLEKGIVLYPRDLGLRKIQADSLTTLNRSLVAERNLKALIQSEPRQPGYFTLLGELYEKQGSLDDACSAYEKAYALDKSGRDTVAGLARVMIKLGRGEQASPILEAAMVTFSGDLELKLIYADILMSRSECAKVISLLGDLHGSGALQFSVEKKLLYSFSETGNHKMVLLYAHRILSRGFPDAHASILYARSLAAMGERGESRKVLIEALKKDPYNRELITILINS